MIMTSIFFKKIPATLLEAPFLYFLLDYILYIYSLKIYIHSKENDD